MSEQEYISLKWGTLKGWNFKSEDCQELMKQYIAIGSSASAMMQNDTPEQKELICQMIDKVNAETIYMDWDDEEVPKEKAKQYVREYGTRASA